MSTRKRFSIENLIKDYQIYLQSTGGRSSGTSYQYTAHIRNFLRWKYKGEIDLADVSPADLIAFMSEYAFGHKPKTSKLSASALRSFFQFLQLKGLCRGQLADAVPTVPAWKLSSLPNYLSQSQVEQFMCVFDTTTASGRRGNAIAQCMLMLGLRAGEVAQLSLDDIDWRMGVIGIPKTKVRRVDTLPLPTAVGEAIVAYLRNGRPPTVERQIFVSHGYPRGKALRSSAISRIIRQAICLSGIEVTSKGSHILRHTAATRMVQAGASLKQIADVLRHRHLDTTMIYTKVDLPHLREVAMQWPEVKS